MTDTINGAANGCPAAPDCDVADAAAICDGADAAISTLVDAELVPDELLAITLNVCVLEIWAETVGPVLPSTSWPLQRKVSGAVPAAQDAVNVTVPPPGGRETGTGVIVQPDGAGVARATLALA